MDNDSKTSSERASYYTAHALSRVSNGYFLSIGLVCLAMQTTGYLFGGVWHSITLLSVLTLLDIEWATKPHIWLSLHRTLADCQLFLIFIVSGLAGVFYTLAICLVADINPDTLR